MHVLQGLILLVKKVQHLILATKRQVHPGEQVVVRVWSDQRA